MDKKSITNKIAAIVLILFIMVVLTSILMPTLSNVRKSNVQKNMEYAEKYRVSYGSVPMVSGQAGYTGEKVNAMQERDMSIPLAIVNKFDAEISLTPTLSVGTATAESIYIAEFKSTIQAKAAEKSLGKCQIALPLPPQIISLADVNVTVNGDPSEDFTLGQNCLIWKGTLDSSKDSIISVTYSAVGKGIYTLEKPAGKVIEFFKTTLTANKGNIRMLQLSLQPSKLQQTHNSTIYTWEYKRLVAAQPIAISVSV